MGGQAFHDSILKSKPIIFSSALQEDEKMRRNFANEGGLSCFLHSLGDTDSKFSKRPWSSPPVCSIRPNLGYLRMTRRLQSGFTLLETAVVTVLATIFLSITVPKIEQILDYYSLSASADLVASELNAGRALAISRNWIYDVNLDTGDSTIQIIDANDPNNSPRTEKSLQSGNTFSSVPVSRIRFYSRGHARAGTIVLVNQSGYSISIVVSPSGRIKQS